MKTKFSGFQIDDMKKAGMVDFSNDGQQQPMFARMANGRQARPHVAREHAVGGAAHAQREAKQQHAERSEVVHTHNHVGGESIDKAAARLEKAMDAESLNGFASLFGNQVTRMEKAIDKQVSEAGSSKPGGASADSNVNVAGLDFGPFGTYTASFDASVVTFGSHTASFANAVASFGKSVANIPTKFDITTNHDVKVSISGGEALAEELSREIISAVKELAGEGIPLDRIASGLSVSVEKVQEIVANPKPQRKPRASTRFYEAFGESKSMGAWSLDKRCKVGFRTLLWRLKNGWDVELALTALHVKAAPKLKPISLPKLYHAFGEAKSLEAWGKDDRCLVCINTLRKRVGKAGWEFERALTTPALPATIKA